MGVIFSQEIVWGHTVIVGLEVRLSLVYVVTSTVFCSHIKNLQKP